MSQCPWTIRWGLTLESTTQCAKNEHIGERVITPMPDGRFTVDLISDGRHRGDDQHQGPGLIPGQRITWQAGDRREYTGGWPGPCLNLSSFTCPVCGMTSHSPADATESYCGNCHDWTGPRLRPCTLPNGHHGRCAP